MQALKLTLLVAAFVFVSCRSNLELEQTVGPTFVYHDERLMVPFPSDRFLAKDEGPRAATDEYATGYHIEIAQYDQTDPALSIAPYIAESLAGLDGFGTSAEIAVGLTFGADVTSLTDAATAFERSVEADSPIALISIDPNSPDAGKPLPFVARLEDDGNTLFIRPWKPLRASSWYAVVFKPGLRDGTGRKFVSPPDFAENFHNPAGLGLEGEGYTQLRNVYANPVVFALTFRTASIKVKMRKLADEVRAATPSAITYTTHAPGAGQPAVATIVEGWFTHRDYRDRDGKLTNAVVSEEKIPFTLALPLTSATVREPFPVVLAQHGFGSNRRFVLTMADAFAREGMATLAIDAPNHGSRGPGDGKNEDFVTGLRKTFGIWTDGDSAALKAWYFRDVLRQQVLGHLQLLKALEAWQGDVTRPTNEAGIADLDLQEAGYIGHSMGAVMGGVSGAVNTEFKRVVLNVGGGRITDVFIGNERFGELAMLVFGPRGANSGDGWRSIAMIQTAIDPGDPINYVAHIGREPFEGEAPRPLLMQNVLHDFLVANHMSFALARAVDAPLIGPYFMASPDTPHVKIPSGGFAEEGQAYIAMFRDIRIDGEPKTADHGNQLASDTGLSQSAPFLRTGVIYAPDAP